MKQMTPPLRWAMLVSALVGLIGLQWWAAPDTYPFGTGAGTFVSVGPEAAAVVAGALGGAGIATAWAFDRPRFRRPALSGAGFQAVAFGYALPQGMLDTVLRHGSDGVDSGSLYALGALVGGALWVMVLVGEVRAAHDERLESERSPKTTQYGYLVPLCRDARQIEELTPRTGRRCAVCGLSHRRHGDDPPPVRRL